MKRAFLMLTMVILLMIIPAFAKSESPPENNLPVYDQQFIPEVETIDMNEPVMWIVFENAYLYDYRSNYRKNTVIIEPEYANERMVNTADGISEVFKFG